MKKNRKILEKTTKLELLDIVKNSEFLREVLTPGEIIEMGRMIVNLPRNEAINILWKNRNINLEQVQGYEDTDSKVSKYAGAALAGRLVVPKLKAMTPILRSMPGAGKAAGWLVGAAGLFLYRNLSDPCKRFSRDPIKMNECKKVAIRKVVGNLQQQLPRCAQTANPPMCAQKIHNDIGVWVKRLNNMGG